MTLFRNLNRDSGITVVLVTHATEVAAWTERIVTFRDGLIMDDRRSGDVLPGLAHSAGSQDNAQREEVSS